MLKEKTFNTGTVTLNYAEGPATGSPIVLMHGLSARWQEFLPITPVLAQIGQVNTIDFRGHGKSEHTDGPYMIQNYVDDVVTFLKKKLDEPAILLGHSLGGMVGIMVAAQMPQAVKALIVLVIH